MKSIAVLSILFVAVAGNPILLQSRFIPIRSFNHDIGANGIYSHRSEGGDGTIASESGALTLPAGSLEAGATKTGHFSYTSPDGQLISLAYTADENGFRPTGSHLPVPPPMPEEIRAMLPTLPKLVEVHEHAPLAFVRAPQHFAVREPILIRDSSPVFVSSHQRVLLQEPAPEKTLVQTSQFFIDSDQSKTIVRIGQ